MTANYILNYEGGNLEQSVFINIPLCRINAMFAPFTTFGIYF